jgi:aryl-alcohol dehydrogenase-like predicted oxidoreductase
MSSAVIFGAAALKDVDQATADRTLDLLLKHGVNHIDTAPGYGHSELRIGPWMARHRGDFFLATKTRIRDYAGARDEIRRSLERLRTDRVDLLQLHALFNPTEWDQAMGEDGALRAAVEARDEGLIRFIGVTGHGWTVAAMHRKSLERFPFDSVLMPWNWFCAQNPVYAEDFRTTLKLCEERGVAVQTIKALARGAWAAAAPRTHATWYQPLEDPDDIRIAAHWILEQPGIFLNSVGDVTLLPLLLEAAEEVGDAPGEPVMTDFAARTGLSSIFGI